jgi:pilus assembly protein CpaC
MREMRNILRITFLLSFIITIGYNSCLAQEIYNEGKLITLYLAELKVFAVDNPTRITISNPEVADVASVSKDEMLISAKGPGTTNLIWWDSLGQHALQLRVFAEDMSAVKQRIDSLLAALDLPDIYTHCADSEGTVLLLGRVNTHEDLERIDTVLAPLEGKITNLIKIEEEASIEIAMQILEINKSTEKDLGFTPPSDATFTEGLGKYGNKLTDIPEALFHLGKWTRATPFDTTLNFLLTEGKARILSRPRLVCQSGKEAELLVGGEKPILTTTISEGGAGTEVEYKEYGIKLKIRPRVMPRNRIQVSLDVEVSEIEAAETLGPSETSITAKAFPLIKRSTSTELILNNSQTLAISGLIRQKTEEELKKFPWLADIPILGIFFRGRTVKTGGGSGERGDTELVITLTPTILVEAGASLAGALSRGGKPERIVKPKMPYLGISNPAIASYTRRVIKRIQDNFVYPPEAYQKNLEGVVNLSLHLASTGELLEVKIRQSSGLNMLDENMLRIIKRVSPFPAFPPDIEEKELRINIPVAYNIK